MKNGYLYVIASWSVKVGIQDTPFIFKGMQTHYECMSDHVYKSTRYDIFYSALFFYKSTTSQQQQNLSKILCFKCVDKQTKQNVFCSERFMKLQLIFRAITLYDI